MRKKWVLLAFALGLGVMLDVTPGHSQFGGGKGGKGERKGERSFTLTPPSGTTGSGFNGGGAGFNGGGAGFNGGAAPGAFGTTPRGAFPSGGSGFNGGGDRGMGGMGGGDRGMGGMGGPPGGFGGGDRGMGMGGKSGDRGMGGFGGDRGMGGPPGGFGGKGGESFGGKGGDRGAGGFGGERRGPDPEMTWNMLVKVSGGTNTIKFDNIPPESKVMMRRMSEKMGTPPLPETGEMSKDQFMAYANASAELIRANSGNGSGNDWGRGGFGEDRRDREGFDPRTMGRGREKKEEEEERPIAIRYGKLPKDAPAMFTEMDGDRDGQIGLHEWRTSGNSILSFQEMDLNGDGLLTVDEHARYTQQKADREKASAYENGETPVKSGATTGRGPGMGSSGRGPGGRDSGPSKESTPNYFGPSDGKSKDSSSKEEKRNGKDSAPGGRGPWGGEMPRPGKK